MGKKNKILEIDFDFANISPEDLIDSLGIPDCTIEDLLELLKQGADSATIMIQNFDRREMKEYNGIGKRYAPVAFAIYGRLLRKHKEPRLPIYLVTNRCQSCDCGPNTVIFWDDPDIIVGLYESLEKDGYYASST